MRTIKFRGKRYGDGAWVYGNLYQGTKEGEQYSIILDEAGYDLAPEDDRNLAIAFAENEVNVVFTDSVGQFTGLLDKSGTEIYEGDIIVRVSLDVFAENHNIPIDILRDDEYKRMKYIVGHGGGFFTLESEKRVSLRLWLDCNDYQVIGNIHENPDLMNNH